MRSSRQTVPLSRPVRTLAALFLAGAVIGAVTLTAQDGKPRAATAKAVGDQLINGFSVSSPFDPDAPDHLWLDNGDGTWMFLHFDRPLDQASKLIYVGWAVPGTWCAEEQLENFTHFHRTARVAEWNAGHGGARPGQEGYWLKHVAVEEFEFDMMGMKHDVKPGTDMKFMPTNPPSCG